MREQKTDPRAAAVILLVILLIAGALYLRLWANAQRLDVPTFRAMAVSQQGNLHVVVGNTLFIESPGGEQLQQIDLADWGVYDFHGDITVMEDGSVVLARGLLEDIDAGEAGRMIARATSADDPTENLMRCQPQSGECSVLDGDGNAAQLMRVFSMDSDGEYLYVSEPSRHRIHKLSLDGEILATSKSGWQFPNSVRVAAPGRIGFADTNHHRYVEASLDTEDFGEVAETIDINGWPEIIRLVRFPSEALKDENNTLWMLIARHNMNDATLYRYPEFGPAELLPLPEDADPLELAQIPGAVIAADARNFRLHRFDLDGKPQPDFGSPELKAELEQLQARHDRWKLIFDVSLFVVLLVAVPALVFGYRLQKMSGKEDEAPAEQESMRAQPKPIPVVEPKTLEGQYAKLRGEFIFWRKYSALSTSSERWFLPTAVLAPLLFLFAMAGWVDTRSPEANAMEQLLTSKPFLLLLAALGATFVLAWLSGMFERIVVSSEGIRYTSLFPKPFSRLVMPGWFLRWDEITDIRLEPGAIARAPAYWRYRVFTSRGRNREIKAFAWRLAGEPETGLTLGALLTRRLAPEYTRSILQQTLLYRLLSKAMQSQVRAAA